MKRIFFWAVLLWLGVRPMQAQQPATSTPDSPIWYYIQVLGDGDRAGRVMTALSSEEVYGRALVESLDTALTAPQLWRAEATNGRLCLINKATGRYLSVAYDDSRAIGVASMSERPTCTFRLAAAQKGGGAYCTLQASSAPQGGSSAETYLHQANDGGSRDYVIMLVGTDYSGSENSAFRFVRFEDYNVRPSSERVTYWYEIGSALPELSGLRLAAAAPDAATADPFELQAAGTTDMRGQWKVMERPDGRIDIINRHTGAAVGTETVAVGLYNMVQPATPAAAGAGWHLDYIGGGQYLVSAPEADGITRYWSATAEGEAPQPLPEGTRTGTAVAWRWHLVGQTATGIETAPPADARPTVHLEGRRLRVSGADSYALYSVGGQRLPHDATLHPGMYVLKAGAHTLKVFVP